VRPADRAVNSSTNGPPGKSTAVRKIFAGTAAAGKALRCPRKPFVPVGGRGKDALIRCGGGVVLVQTVWPVAAVIERRQEELRREAAECRRRGHGPPPRPAPPGSLRVRLGWRLVETGLRLALPAGSAAAGPPRTFSGPVG
jgi:hypothetical protein